MNAILRYLLLMVLAAAPVAASDSVSRGEQVFAICANCHTLEKGGEHRCGPNLHGIIGREIASAPGFDYSAALKAEKGVWTRDKLDLFLTRPKMAVPCTKMAFKGLENEADRKALIIWLAEIQTGLKPEPDPTALGKALRGGDPRRGRALFRPCRTCHTFEKGDPSTIGPNLFGIMGRRAAMRPDFAYSDRLQFRNIVWTPETLNAYFVEAKPMEQGTHRAFLVLETQANRADMIAYLRSISPAYREEEPHEADAEKESPAN